MFTQYTHVSFSKVTDADFGASGASDEGVTEREVIFPLEILSAYNPIPVRV
jgi:hypothetical protein